MLGHDKLRKETMGDHVAGVQKGIEEAPEVGKNDVERSNFKKKTQKKWMRTF